MTLKQENGIAALLAALPVILFLAVSDGVADRVYTHVTGPGGLWMSKASFARAAWFFGALQYGVCLSLKAGVGNRLPGIPAASVRFLAGFLLSAAFGALILSNLA